MIQTVPINPTGRINRRDLPHMVGDDEVLIRENFYVIGNDKEKRNRKVPGANRFSDNDTGTFYSWAHRYYSRGLLRKTFAFNNGMIYHIDDNGNETAGVDVFSPVAIPCSEVMRISSNDLLLFSEGNNTGMYSHDGNIANVWTKETSVELNFVGMLVHLDRVFGFEEDSEDLYFSKNLEPFNYTDSTDAGVITIGPKRGSKIMAIALLYGTIYIFKQDSIWKLIGRTPAEFEVIEVHQFLGTAARRSVVNNDTGTGIFFLGSDFEFYFFGGTADSTIMISYKTAIGGDYTKNLLPIINRDKTDSIVATFHNKIYRCSLVESGSVENNLEYCFNTINETDFFTRGFNISCYCKWDRYPDKNELLTGRADAGYLMKQYVGLNTDNQASSPSMRFRIQTKFIGSSEPKNVRFKRAFFNCEVLGAEPIKVFYPIDSRSARSDMPSDDWITRGEYKTVAGIKISSQTEVVSRINLKYGKTKGRSISFLIDHEGKDVDFGFSKIDVEAIVKKAKKSEKIAA